MALLNFTNGQNNSLAVHYENGVYLGDLETGLDGFYVYWPINNGGYWSSHIMREIADKIDELDRPLIEEMNKYWEGQEGKTPDVVEN